MYSGFKIYNELPKSIKSIDNVNTFRRKANMLKKYMNELCEQLIVMSVRLRLTGFP